MNSHYDADELRELLHAFAEQQLDARDESRLEALLRDHKEARVAYLRWSMREATLYWDYRGLNSPPAPAPADTEIESSASRSSLRITRRFNSLLDRASNRPVLSSIAVALVVFASLLLVLALTPVGQFVVGGSDGQRDEPMLIKAQEIATLTAWYRPEWVKQHAISPRNHRITAGQTIAFTTGMIEITYDSGAKIVMEGPAEFVVGSQVPDDQQETRGQRPGVDTNSGFLRRGRLVARVESEAAKGFTVGTPTGAIEDLGTEFGVDVRPSGKAVVEVFEGRVRVGEAGRDGRVVIDGSRVMEAGQALAIDTQRRWADIDPERRSQVFVRNLPKLALVDVGDEVLQRDQYDGAQGVLFLRQGTIDKNGRIHNLTFFSEHADRSMTPLLFAYDADKELYRITGIGRSILCRAVGAQTRPFELLAGSDQVHAGVHTWGYFDGLVESSSQTTAAIAARNHGAVSHGRGGPWVYCMELAALESFQIGQMFGFADADRPDSSSQRIYTIKDDGDLGGRTYSLKLTIRETQKQEDN